MSNQRTPERFFLYNPNGPRLCLRMSGRITYRSARFAKKPNMLLRPPAPPRHVHAHRAPKACPHCGNKKITRKGKRRNKYGDIQLFYCRACKKKFTPLLSKNRTFPLRVILDALTIYNTSLCTIEQAAAAASRKHGIAVSRQNVANWLRDYREHFPFLRLRPAALRRVAGSDGELIVRARFLHRQIYEFQYHRAKTKLILGASSPGADRHAFAPLRDFLEDVPRSCPHGLFTQANPRASAQKGRFDPDAVTITHRRNAAVRNAAFVLQSVSSNKLRHAVLQEFMLANDSVTVAAEVPVYLTANDLAAIRAQGGHVPLTLARGETITGHIDIVQIRYGLIHILDYKPDARKMRPIEQLTLYALALSQLTGIRLYHFKCAWFDDEDYFDFFPRALVFKNARL
jgi:transposase-like protein